MDHLRLLIDALRANDWKCSLRHALHLAALLADTYLDDGHPAVGMTVADASLTLAGLTEKLAEVAPEEGVQSVALPSWVWPVLLKVLEELLKRV